MFDVVVVFSKPVSLQILYKPKNINTHRIDLLPEVFQEPSRCRPSSYRKGFREYLDVLIL